MPDTITSQGNITENPSGIAIEAMLDDIGKRFADLSWQRGANGEAVNPQAARVEQRQVGYSADQPIGTDNINDCIGLIIRDPVTHKTALAHIDKVTDESTYRIIMDGMPERKPGAPPFEATLIGARYQHGDDAFQENIDTAYENERKVKQFLAAQGIPIVAQDLHNGDKPIAFVVDPKTGAVTREVPGQGYADIHITNGLVAGRMMFDSGKKPLLQAFDLTVSPERAPLLLRTEEIEQLQPFLGRSRRQISDTFLEKYDALPGFPGPQNWKPAFYQEFFVRVERAASLTEAYQQAVGEVISHLDTKIAALRQQGVIVSDEDRTEAMIAAVHGKPLHIGANAAQTNKPLFDFIDSELFLDGHANIQGLKDFSFTGRSGTGSAGVGDVAASRNNIPGAASHVERYKNSMPGSPAEGNDRDTSGWVSNVTGKEKGEISLG